MDIEKLLKDSIDIEKEAWATAEALGSLVLRKNVDTDNLMEEYAEDLTYMQEKSEQAIKIMRTLPEGEIRRIFIARYIHRMTWEEVADATYLSLTHVQRLHRQGIEWLNEKFVKDDLI
ncbi:MAG: hypothetical protein FWE34_05920 [Defluviitaleaceae bacterium]|nr:hypothetical protein [Defluviitaleaceae bacterium]